MAKDTYYFSHDYEPTSDPKIQAMIGNLGAAGYGIFWRIIEMLHSNPDHKLPFKKYIYEAIAKQMLTSAEQIKTIIIDFINEYELLKSDENHFWSERVKRNIEARNSISATRSASGKLGAIAKQKLANTSKGKEIKGNKIKGNKKKETLKEELFEKFWIQYGKDVGRDRCIEKFLGLPEADLDKIFQTLPAYVASTPDPFYRKKPENYLNTKAWNDPIETKKHSMSVVTDGTILPKPTTEEQRLKHKYS